MEQKECDCGHVCTSGCQNDFDCPCLENCGEQELTNKQQAQKELFEMVYQWGRAGIVTDWECNAFQKKLQEIISNK